MTEEIADSLCELIGATPLVRHQLTRLFTDGDGAPTGHIKSANAPGATYIWIESEQCIRCGERHRACPTYAIPIRKADFVCGPIE